MKEISMSTYQEMRNEAWDMAVKTKMVEDKDWLDFDSPTTTIFFGRLHDSRLNNSK